MINFLMHVFKWSQYHSIYWALENMRATKQVLGQPMAYRHMTRDTNCVANDMARRALEARATITFWDRQVPENAPDN